VIVNLYKSKSLLAVLSFPIALALLGLPILFIESKMPTVFFSWQMDLAVLVLQSPIIHYFTTVFLVYIAAIVLNKLVNVYGFYSKNTYLPGFIYAVGLFGFGQFTFSMHLPLYFFLIVGLGYLFRINRQESAIGLIFGTALTFGVASIFDPTMLPLLLLPWLSLLVFKPFVWREWLILIIGFIIPWIYHFAIYYMIHGSGYIPYSKPISEPSPIDFSVEMITFNVFTIGLVIYSFMRYLVISRTELLIFKKRSRIIYHFCWLGFLTLGCSWFFFDTFLLAIHIPFSIIVGVQMLNSKHIAYTNLVIYVWLALMGWHLFL
jgi:hypothetical protein